ncbi:MAG TPA: twin-arginine translocation signal domain-containing protein, partial [Pirellulales bacterium]|nr:twin-arginine translocation signal domain-containing protein [Pirellulales bacterium]
MDRRDFLAKTTAAGVALGAPSLAAADAPARKLGTCGPPPRKNPERQTAAEGMPPLPLPVTPLRRSEPKAEPTPPMMVAKLEYGTTQ